MAILSTNQKLIKVDVDYSAGQNIYFDGDDNHVINGKDWGNEINDASANAFNTASSWVAQNYANSADMTYISAMVDTKLDTSAWSSVSSDLATESYVIMSDNMTYGRATAYVESKGYATETFVNEKTSGKLDSSSFANVSGDFLTTSFGISESGAWNEATNCVETNSAAWFDNQGDAEVNELVYAQSANWNEVSSKLDSSSFDTWQQGQYTNDITSLTNLIGTKLDTSSFEETSGTFYPTSNPSGFITGVDLSNYYTKGETSGAYELEQAFANIPLGDEEVNELVHSNSGEWNNVSSKLDTTAFSDVSSTFLTAHQSLDGYATTSWVNEQGYITGVDLSNYYTKDETSGKEELASAFANIPGGDPEVNAYVTSNSASIDESTNVVQSNSSTWNDVTVFQSNSASYITAHQSLEGLMSASLLESADGKWTAYNSIPFKAGDEFPISADEAIQYVQTNSAGIDETVTSYQTNSSTYMVEPNLEYNAVGEISGYGNSAIAQYGAEKQWLTHDDTIVHVSNSAQYAFGCNISALQRLMGIDETVLYNNTAATTADVAIGSTFNINEPITNFNKFKIYYSRFPVTSNGSSNGGPCSQIREYDSTACSSYFVIHDIFPTSTQQNPDWFDISMLIETISGTTWKCKACYQSKLPSGALDRGWTYLKPYKIIGIGRISG